MLILPGPITLGWPSLTYSCSSSVSSSDESGSWSSRKVCRMTFIIAKVPVKKTETFWKDTFWNACYWYLQVNGDNHVTFPIASNCWGCWTLFLQMQTKIDSNPSRLCWVAIERMKSKRAGVLPPCDGWHAWQGQCTWSKSLTAPGAATADLNLYYHMPSFPQEGSL